jgi:uncharacterized protein YbjT (DUF2867 family)
MDSVFAVTTPMAGVDLEVRQGIAVSDAVKAAGAGHLVFSSVASADRGTGIPHFDSKFRIEEHIRNLGVPWTITAPAFFYDNALFPWNAADLQAGRFRQALKPGLKLQQVSVRDIGRFNALVIGQPDRFIGQRIDFAGDELTGPGMAQALSQGIGKPVTYQEQPLEEVRAQFADMATMYEWFDREGFAADIPSLRRDYPEVGWLSFADWAANQDWNRVLAQSA